MMSEHILELCERGAAAMLDSVLHAALLLLLVALALKLLPTMTAAVRSLIWTAVLGVVMVLAFLPLRSAETLSRGGEALKLNPAWSLAIVCAWVAFSLWRAGQLLVSGVRLRRIRAAAKLVEGSAVARVTLGFGIERTAAICTSDEVAQPSVIGFFAPRIVVPSELYPQLSKDEVAQIVLHEMEHLRRLDDWRNLLQKIAVMLLPLNPALLWIERRLCLERELACDESVLEQTHAPKSYAACLVHLAEQRSLARRVSLALGAWERRSELARRVHGILSSRTQRIVSARLRSVSAGAVMTGMIALAFGLAKSPRIVTFEAPAALAVADARTAGLEPVRFGSSDAGQPRMIDTVLHVPAAGAAPKKGRAKAVRFARPQIVPRFDARVGTRVDSRFEARLDTRLDDVQQVDSQPRVTLTSWTYNEATGTLRVQRVTFAVFEVANGARGAVEGAAQVSSTTSGIAQAPTSSLFFFQL